MLIPERIPQVSRDSLQDQRRLEVPVLGAALQVLGNRTQNHGIDLSLTANLLLIVIFAGYENFVSKIHIGEHEDRPSWMGTVDFSNLKIKLIASIVAISAIALLRAFLPLADAEARVDQAQLHWMVVIHLTFVISGVLLAVMDWVSSRVVAHTHSARERQLP